MTVSTTLNRIVYTGNGTTTVFSFPYKFIAGADIKVYLAGVLQTTGYTVGTPTDTGANVTFSSAPATGASIVLVSDPARLQSTSLPSTGPFPAKSVETMADKLTLLVQRLYDLATRSLTLSDSDVSTVQTTLPSPAANNILGWNGNGTGLQNVPITTLATAVTYGTANSDVFSGNGVQTSFTLSGNPGALNNLDVSISGVTQRPGIDYTWASGTTITFTTAPVLGTSNVLVRYMQALAQGTSDAGSTTYSDAASYSSGTVGYRLKQIISSAGASLVGFLQAGSGVSTTRTVQDKLRETISIADFGAVCDGVTNDTAAVQAAITSIGSSSKTLLIPGPTKINTGLTFGAATELEFTASGYFLGTSGAEVLQVQRQIIAGPRQIFNTCAPISTVGCTVFPEWFGAKGDGTSNDSSPIQAAIDFVKNTGGVVQFDARTYNISTNINIGTGGAGSTGQNTTLQGKGYRATILRTTTATGTAIQILGASGSMLQGVSIRELGITKSVAGTGGYGIYAQYTALLKLRDVLVSDYLYGVGLLRATNSLLDKVLVTFSGSTNNWHGFELNGGGTGAGGNASSVFRDCYCDGTGATGTGSIGFYAYGAYVSDLIFDACETTTVDVGFQFDCGSSLETGNEDVQMLNCRADMIKSYGTYINQAGVSGTPVSMFTILGGWYNHRSTGAESDSIYLNQCRGVVISGVQFVCFANYTQAYHVKMNACNNIIVSNCLFSDMKYGVYAVNSGYSQISGNRFYAQTGRTATNYIVASGASRMMVTNNVFDGYCTNAVNFDATSSGCGIVGNTANITNITTRFTNNSTGPIGAVDGSTGLNSGV